MASKVLLLYSVLGVTMGVALYFRQRRFVHGALNRLVWDLRHHGPVPTP